MEEQELKKLARLSRLDVSEDELAALKKDFASILGYISKIQKVSGDPRAAVRAGELRNVMRADENPHDAEAHTKPLMEEVPQKEKGWVKVKKILR